MWTISIARYSFASCCRNEPITKRPTPRRRKADRNTLHSHVKHTKTMLYNKTQEIVEKCFISERYIDLNQKSL